MCWVFSLVLSQALLLDIYFGKLHGFYWLCFQSPAGAGLNEMFAQHLPLMFAVLVVLVFSEVLFWFFLVVRL